MRFMSCSEMKSPLLRDILLKLITHDKQAIKQQLVRFCVELRIVFTLQNSLLRHLKCTMKYYDIDFKYSKCFVVINMDTSYSTGTCFFV